MNITNENFESVINDNKSVMIKVGAEWCGPCRTMKPIIEALTEEYKGRVVICEADADECTEIVDKFKIRGIPMTLFFKNGKLVDRQAGGAGKTTLVEKLQQIL